MPTQAPLLVPSPAHELAHRGTIVLPTRFDVHEVDDFVRNVDADPANGGRLLVDCRQVAFMDESAIQALLDSSLTCAERGVVLLLTSLSTAARVTLELTGTALLLTVASESGADR